MKSFVEFLVSRKCALMMLGVVGLVAASWGFAGSYTGDPERYGPYVCKNGCLLGSPVADPKTAAFLAEKDSDLNIILDTRATGDEMVVCNEFSCVTYTRTDSDHFEGGSATDRTESGGDSGDSSAGGGGSGGSGGAGGGGGAGWPPGCYGECDPNVNVGNPENAPE